jgi:heat shock protein HtpX
MKAGRRRYLLLFGLGLTAFGNGFLLALSLYGLLAAALHLFGNRAPGLGWGLAVGVLAGAALLGLSHLRARGMRRTLYGESLLDRELPLRSRPTQRLAALAAKTSLPRAPSLRWADGEIPNAFAVGRSREDAAILVTPPLFEFLDEDEQDAVLAHELARVEADDLGEVGFADAIAASVDDLGELKDKYFWGPAKIFAESRALAISFLALIVVSIYASENNGGGILVSLLGLAIVVALVRNATRSWRGTTQLFLLVAFLGPLTLVEWALAPPTAAALSRLISRHRVGAADRRGAVLCGDAGAAISALRRLEGVEYVAGDPWRRDLRFSLYVTPRAQGGYRAWLERITSTHPSVAERIEDLERLEGELSEETGARKNAPAAPTRLGANPID